MKPTLLITLLIALLFSGCGTTPSEQPAGSYIDTDTHLYERLKKEGRIAREWNDGQYLMFATVETTTVDRRHLFGVSKDMKIVEKIYRVPLSEESRKTIRKQKDAKARAGHVENMKKKPTGWFSRLSKKTQDNKDTLPAGLKGTLLFDRDARKAAKYFEKLITSRKQKDWDVLADLLHQYPPRYAFLMSKLTRAIEDRENSPFTFLTRSSGTPESYAPYTAYIMKQVHDDLEFARRSATAWKEGWHMTKEDVIDRLSDSDHASTRRIAIEYLKSENNGETYGFDWMAIPASPLNQAAVKKWKEWEKTQ